MDVAEALPLLAEAPVAVALAAAVLVLAWAIARVLTALLRAPRAIVDAMNEAGETTRSALNQAMSELRQTYDDLQVKLWEERTRVERLHAEISSLKLRLALAEQGRQQAIEERDACQAQLAELRGEVERLRRGARQCGGRAA